MQRLQPFVLLVAVLFTAYTALVGAEHGAAGFVSVVLRDDCAMQLFIDLFISLLMVTSAMVIDARRRKRAAWPWVMLTALVGSVGPLWYLALRKPTKLV